MKMTMMTYGYYHLNIFVMWGLVDEDDDNDVGILSFQYICDVGSCRRR